MPRFFTLVLCGAALAPSQLTTTFAGKEGDGVKIDKDKRTVAIDAFSRSPSTSTRIRRTATSRPRRSRRSALSRSPWTIASKLS